MENSVDVLMQRLAEEFHVACRLVEDGEDEAAAPASCRSVARGSIGPRTANSRPRAACGLLGRRGGFQRPGSRRRSRARNV